MEVMILITNKYHYDPPTETEPLFWGCEGDRRKAVFHIGEKQLQILCSLYQDYFLAEVSSAAAEVSAAAEASSAGAAEVSSTAAEVSSAAADTSSVAAEVSSAEVFSAALLQEKKATLDTTASNKTNFFIFLKF